MDARRRVVTGHDSNGKAVFVGDEVVEPIRSALGNAFLQLWGADAPATFPDDGSQPSWTSYFPPVGGLRFGLFSIPGTAHEVSADTDIAAEYARFDQVVPGLTQYMEPDDPGMHTTPTVDFELVLSGEVVLELDDGAEVTLRPGDTVVQNGTRHRWRNPGMDPAVMAVFICGAHHERFGT
jgi:mannose-6-phosphate isomerase-like protein (cupin superfamily)